VSIEGGTLYVVATPIGNLADMGQRALEVLQAVDVVAAEDTRHSAVLLAHYGLHTPMFSLHDHNEAERSGRILARLREGGSVALICDAGTPLISDPGYRLVREVRAHELPVVPVPGPSAVVCALSAAGLPTDRFTFEGFLPRATAARRRRLEQLSGESRTMVFYESRYRVLETLGDMGEVFGAGRDVVLAREMTKAYETFRYSSLDDLRIWLEQRSDQQRGEFVLVVAGVPARAQADIDPAAVRVVRILARELPPRRAAALAAEITGVRKNRLYEVVVRDTQDGGR
jgi:16S rRNA (cytidine1402-2'-O)-methyltransferase